MSTNRNNQGITLLELILAMAISMIVIVMIISLISVGTRMFRKTSDDVNLQVEAQTTMNQIVNLVMEAKSIEEITLSSSEKRYLIDQPDTADYKDYAIILDGREDVRELYLVELASGMDYRMTVPSREMNLLSEYVTDLTITPEGTGRVQRIYLKLMLGSESYELAKKVILRNYITGP